MSKSLSDLPFICLFLPPSLRGASTARARRFALFILYNIVLLVSGAPFTYILGIQLGLTYSSLAVLAGIVMIVIGMCLLRWTGRLDIASHWVSFSLYSALCIIIFQTDGIASPGLWWLAICPIYTLLFSGLRAGLLWVNLVVLTGIGFYTTGLSAQPLATRLTIPDLRWLQLSSFLGLTAVVVGYVASYRYFITRNRIQRLNQRRKNEREARKRAERANRARTQFFSNTSHQIRTPINTITGKMDLLRNTDLTDEQREHFEIIDESSRQLLDTIDKMLDISMMESGSIDMKMEPLHPRQVVNDVLRDLSPAAATSDINLIQTVDPSVPTTVVGDEQRFSQILRHLVQNAITHSGADEIRVQVHEQDRSDSSGTLLVEVIDNGIGIKADEQSDIFESFLRTTRSRENQVAGTGIGLAICRELVNLFQGDIGVDSTPGDGSTFHFTAEFEAPDNGFSSPSYQASELRDMTVLMQVNNASRAASLSSRLEHWNMHPISATTPDQFLDDLLSHPSLKRGEGLLVLDCDTSEVEVKDVLDQIEQITEARPPVVLMTRCSSDTDVSSINRAEAHISTPIHGPSLLKQFKEALTAGSSPHHENTSDSPPSSSSSSIPDTHLLLTEDNDAVRAVIKMQLQQLGHTVTAVSDGRAAVEEIRDNPDINLVIMDVQMPVLDGIEATKAIRNLDTDRSSIPIVALTANALASNRRKCLEAGMNDYMTKPADLSELQEMIRKLRSSD